MDTSWYMTQEENARLTEELRSVHRTLQTAVDAFPRMYWAQTASDGGWSAAEIVEHIFLAQRVLCEQIRSHLEDPARPELLSAMEKQRERLVRYLPGGGKAQAGTRSTNFQGLQPESVPGNIIAAEQQFSELLNLTGAYPVKVIAWASPFFGELSAYLWIHYPALHTKRHIAQFERLRASWVAH